MNVRTVLAVAVITAGASVGTACSPGGERNDARSFDLTGRTLVVDTDTDISVRTATGSKVEVERRLKGEAASEGGASWSMDAGVLKLRADCDSILPACSASHDITVPEGVAVRVRTGNADVEATGLADGLDIDAESGDVNLRDVAGVTKVYTTNGDVSVDTTTAPDRLTLQSGNGDVGVRLPDGAYRLDVRTGAGDQDVKARHDPMSARIVSVRTGNGDVSIG